MPEPQLMRVSFSIFYENPAILLTPSPLFVHILSYTPPLFLLPCFFAWMCDRATTVFPWYQQHLVVCLMHTASNLLKIYTDDMVFATTLIWYHTHRQTQRTQEQIDWHKHTHARTHVKNTNTTCYVHKAATCIKLN